jgi:hypothetical protein
MIGLMAKKPVARYCPFKIPTWSCESPLLPALRATDLCSVSHLISLGLKPEKKRKSKINFVFLAYNIRLLFATNSVLEINLAKPAYLKLVLFALKF